MAGHVTAGAGGPDRGSPTLRSQLATFAWLRWRQTANSVGRGRRGALQRLAAVGELAGKIILVSMAGAGALGLAVGAVFAGLALAREGDARSAVLLVLRVGLAIFTLTLFFFPALRAMNRGNYGRTRLLLLPIAPRRLHALEVGAHLADPWLLLIVPALGTLGLAVAWTSGLGGLVALAAGVLFLLVLTLLSSVASFGLELLLRDRRRAEWVLLVVMCLWVVGAMTPGLQQSRHQPRPSGSKATSEAAHRAKPAPEAPPAGRAERSAPGSAARAAGSKLDALERFPVWLQVVPSEAYARAVARGSAGRSGAALASLLALALIAFVVFRLSFGLWRRLLASPAGSSARAGARAAARPLHLPGLSPGAAVVAWAQVRTYLRTLPGRLSVVTLPVVLLALIFMLRGSASRIAGLERLGFGAGAALALGSAVFANLSLQSLSLNLFAIDGPGFSLSVLSPLSRRDLVLGKAAAEGLLATGLTILGSGVVMTLEPAALPFWPAILLAGVAISALLAPLHAWISMFFPKAVDLGRLGKQAQPNQLANLVGLVATAVSVPAATLPAIVVFAFTRSVLAATAAELVWAALALAVSRALLGLAARTLAGREEAIYLALAEGT